MTLYYSKTTNGFYDSEIGGILPDDAIEITKDTHISMMDGQRIGKVIHGMVNGHPELVDFVPKKPQKNIISVNGASNPNVQIASLFSALIAAKVIPVTALPLAQITAMNNILITIGEMPILTTLTIAESI